MNQFHLALAVTAFLFSAPGLAATCDSSDSTATKEASTSAQETHRSTPGKSSCMVGKESATRSSHHKTAAAGSAGGSKASASGYVPKTKDDNTPWRFDMKQNGKRMTAEQFDAWMKAKGIRIATGKPAAAALDEQSLAKEKE